MNNDDNIEDFVQDYLSYLLPDFLWLFVLAELWLPGPRLNTHKNNYITLSGYIFSYRCSYKRKGSVSLKAELPRHRCDLPASGSRCLSSLLCSIKDFVSISSTVEDGSSLLELSS